MHSSPRKIGSLLTLVCVTLTFSLLTLILGMGAGILGQFDVAMKEMPSDMLQVRLCTKNGDAKHQFPIEELGRLEKAVGSAQGIAAQTWELQFGFRDDDGERYSIIPGCMGVSANYFAVRGIEIAEGRFFSSLEEKSGANVAVAAANLEWAPWELGPVEVGSTVKDHAQRFFEVVGICHAGQGTGLRSGLVYVPVLHAYDRDALCSIVKEQYITGEYQSESMKVFPTPGLGGVTFWVTPKPGLSEQTEKELADALAGYNTADVIVEIRPERLATSIAYKTRESIGENLLASSAIVLVVAVINSANLLLLTVMMQSKNIGVRRAVGATRTRVAMGVTGEGVRLALTGIGVGLGLTFAGKGVFEKVFGEKVIISAIPTLKAAGVLCGSLLVAGIYPAMRAAKMPPVEALRGITPSSKGKRTSLDARKVLLVAAVAVGIAGVLLLTATGYAARQEISMYLAAAGDNWVVVEQFDEFEREGKKPLIPLTPELADALSDHTDAPGGWYGVTTTAFALPSSPDIRVGPLLMCTPQYVDLKGFRVSQGQMLTRDDDGKPVCVLGRNAAERMFGGEDPLGKAICISDETQFTVVGVLKQTPAGLMDLEVDRNDAVLLLPGSASLSKDLAPLVYRGGKIVSVASERTRLEGLVASLGSYLETNFPEHEMPNVRAYVEGLEVLSSVRDRLDRAYGIIGALALLMAGIGVNNLMMVIVTERIPEIGIRRAVGATRQDVMGLFLGESLRMGLWGTLFGFGIAIPVIVAVDRGATLTVGAILRFALTAGAMGILTGTLGGYYSARSASWRQPVDAVRYE